MISASQAEKLILSKIKPLPSVSVPLNEARGKVLREDIKSDRVSPPFDRVMLDGIAIHLSQWNKGARVFPLEGVQAAGKPQSSLKNKQHAIEVMTGCMLPKGCNCVIPIEALSIQNHAVRIVEDIDLYAFHGVHRKGADCAKGKVLLKRGQVLLAPQLAIAASVGKTHLKVSQQPSVGIVTTGDELIRIDQKPLTHQLRRSNDVSILHAVQQLGCEHVKTYHYKDHLATMVKGFASLVQRHDVLIISGGISAGKFDYVQEALKQCGFKSIFYRIKQRPGKPMCFGKVPKGPWVFCLPGNPLSSLITCYRYVLPALRQMTSQVPFIWHDVVLSEDTKAPAKDLTRFCPCVLKGYQNGRRYVQIIEPSCSGDWTAVGTTDGFVQLDQTKKVYKKGSLVKALLFSSH